MTLATRVKLGVIVVVGAGIASMAMPTAWWQVAGRDERIHRKKIQFQSNWVVYSHDMGKKLRSDSATVTWHAGEHSHNDVHHGGKFRDSVTLGPGQYVITFRTEVDTATEINCKMIIGKETFPPNGPDRSATGVCALSTTITIT